MANTDLKLDALAVAARQELARRNLADFGELMVQGYGRAAHTDLLCRHLEGVGRGELDRLIVQMPPGFGKSTNVSRALPAWYLGRHPRRSVILGSHSAELAEGHSRAARAIVASPDFPFGVGVAQNSAAVNRWNTTAGGGMIAVGVGGAVTGWRADLAICDDPIADREQADSAAYRERAWRWWQEAFLTRLQPRAGVVLLHTRWHPDDVIGRVLNSPGADKWAVLTLPAICEEADDPLGRAVGESLWPEMFSADDLEAKRLDVGERAWAALYEQRPTPQQGALFRRDWLEGRYARLPEDGLRIVTAVDASFGEGVQSDYSAVVTIAADKTHYYVLHALRGRWHFADLLEQIRRVHCVYGAEAIVVEDTGAGRSALQELRRQSDLPVVGVRPEGSKIARAESVAPLLEGGRVLFPESSPRWRDELIEELASFPQVKHDDLTDAFVYALRRLRERLHSGGIGIAGVIHHTARNEEEPFIDPRVVGAAERGSNLAAAAPTAAVASRPTLKGECRWCGITNTDAPGRIGRNSIVCHRCMRPENRPSGGHTETLAAATHA